MSCGESDDSDLAKHWFFRILRAESAAIRTSICSSKNAYKRPLASHASTKPGKRLWPDFPTVRWKSEGKCRYPMVPRHLQCCHSALKFAKLSPQVMFPTDQWGGIAPKLSKHLKVAVAVEILEVSQGTNRTWGADGKIPMHRNRTKGYRLFKREDVERFQQSMECPTTPSHRRPTT
jgi:hypothetical protein